MKNIIKIVICFVLFIIFGKGNVGALTLPGEVVRDTFEAVPIVVTPTKTLIKQIENVIDIDDIIKPLATKTPTPIVVTQVVTATPNPTVSVVETKPTETVTIEPTVEEIKKTEEELEKTNSDKWFWGIIIGLLVLVLVAQIWSTKKIDGKKQNDIQQ